MKTEKVNLENVIKTFIDKYEFHTIIKNHMDDNYFYNKIKNNPFSLLRVNAYKYLYKNAFAEGVKGVDEYEIEHYLEYYKRDINNAMLTQIKKLHSELNLFWKIFTKRILKQIEKGIFQYEKGVLEDIKYEILSPEDVLWTVGDDIKGDVYFFYKGDLYEFNINEYITNNKIKY